MGMGKDELMSLIKYRLREMGLPKEDVPADDDIICGALHLVEVFIWRVEAWTDGGASDDIEAQMCALDLRDVCGLKTPLEFYRENSGRAKKELKALEACG